MLRTFQEIYTSMKNFIRSKNPTIDLSEGSIANDIFISAPSQEIAKLYEESNIVSQSQSLLTASDSGIDTMGENLSILRKSSRRASGIVKFFTRTSPVTDVTILAGTIISTPSIDGKDGIQFIVTNTVYMYATLAASYLNTTNGVYEISASVEAVRAGISGVVGPQTITKIVTSVSGIDGCYNDEATTGGLDVESTGNLKIRIASKWRGNTIGVADGYLSEVLNYPGVEDGVEFGGIATGREDLGPVDVYIRGNTVTQAQDTFISFSNYSNLIFSKQPVIDTASITIFSSGGGLIDPSLYTFVKDGGAYAGSINGQDKIEWNTVLTSGSGSLLVNYSYNSLIYDLQNYFADPSRNVQNSNLLIKQASEILIDMEFNIKISSGYDTTSVTTEISSQLAIFLDSLSIGALIRQSDIAEIILAISGVEDLQLPLIKLQSADGSIVPDSFDNLQLTNKSYAVLGSLIINTIL